MKVSVKHDLNTPTVYLERFVVLGLAILNATCIMTHTINFDKVAL